MIPEDTTSESEINRELIYAKFKSYASEKFQEAVIVDYDYDEFLSNVNRHFKLNLPLNLSEYFIHINYAALFWLSNHPAVISTGDLAKTDKPDTILANRQNNEIAEIKKFYSNWLYQKNEKEKQYFALSTINQIEKESKNKDYIKNLLHSTILAYEKSLNSPDKAIQLLYKTKDSLDTSVIVNPDLRQELSYLINLFIGFIFFKEGAINEADIKFQEALNNKPSGITGIFYSALSQILLGNKNKALDKLLGLIKADKNRFAYAIKNNNIGLFSYFLSTAYVYNVFNQREFATLLNDLDFSLRTFISPDQTSMEILSDRLENLSTLPVSDFYNEDITKSINFLERYLDLYKSNNNFLLTCLTEYLAEKLNILFSNIIENIKTHYFAKAKEMLLIYEEEIEKANAAIKMFHREMEDAKLKAQKKVEDRIKLSEKEAEEAIAGVEAKINNLENDTKYNPGTSFNSAMLYNIIISLIVFIIGGFGSGLGGNGESSDALNSIFATIIMNGIKWGGITFIIGIIVSFFTATSAIWERTNEKNRLVKQIGVIKIYKEKEIEEIRFEQERCLKSYELNMGNRIQTMEKQFKEL